MDKITEKHLKNNAIISHGQNGLTKEKSSLTSLISLHYPPSGMKESLWVIFMDL